MEEERIYGYFVQDGAAAAHIPFMFQMKCLKTD
jgi:hypothetical protein